MEIGQVILVADSGYLSPTSIKNSMPIRKTSKKNLPQRICVVCEKPFTWRKKWEKVWDEVKYCSDKCRMNKSKNE